MGLRLDRKAYRRLCDVGPSGACNSKHQHMSSWPCHSHWCIGGTHERRGVSRQGEGTSKGLDRLPVSVGRSSCCRLVQRLEEAPWPVAGPWSPFADRIRGQLAGSREPVLAGSRLAGRDPALSLAANYVPDAARSIARHASSYKRRHPKHCSALPARTGMVRTSCCYFEPWHVAACAPRTHGGGPSLTQGPRRAVVNPIKQGGRPRRPHPDRPRRRLNFAEAAVPGSGSAAKTPCPPRVR